MAVRVDDSGNLVVTGTLRVTGAATLGGGISGVKASDLDQDAGRIYEIPLNAWRIWDSLQQLPSAGAADDLAYVAGTFGTDSAAIQTGDLKAAGATTRYARCTWALPAEYEDGETLTIRFRAGMETNPADVAATLDLEVYESDGETGIGADLCTTAAISINSTTYTNADFTITVSGLVAGDLLDMRVAISVNDGATGTAVIGSFGKSQALVDTKG